MKGACLTLSTSDIKTSAAKTAGVYLTAALLCSIFGAVYEFFSFGVYSFFMIFCFMPPLTLGCVPFFFIFLSGKNMMSRLSYNFYNSGVAALTVGFIMKGVIEIYGTTNRLLYVYFIGGAALMITGVVLWIVTVKKNKKTIEKKDVI